MKKIAALILAILYLGFSTGATVHLNYCMGRLVAKSLTHDTSKNCTICGMEKSHSNGCCKDEINQLKIESDQDLPGQGLQATGVFHLAPSSNFERPAVNISALVFNVSQIIIGPPGNTAIFIRNCAFLI